MAKSIVRSIYRMLPLKDILDEMIFSEGGEGIRFLAGSNKVGGDAELVVDRDSDAAFA